MTEGTTAWDIHCGAELLTWEPQTIRIGYQNYTILTGFEGSGRCFWCGGDLEGKAKAYCRGKHHMDEYYRHFRWSYASTWAIRRAGHKCENCGKLSGITFDVHARLEVHHIVPFAGRHRDEFSPFHLPWNLVVLCHDCHVLLHVILNGERRVLIREDAKQSVMDLTRQYMAM